MKFENEYLSDKISFQSIKQKKIIKMAHSAFNLAYISIAHGVLHRMLIGHTHSSQFMEWQNLSITTLKHAACAQNDF